MIGKTIALKVGLPCLAVGSVGGCSYYVADSYVLRKTEGVGAQSSVSTDNSEFKITLKGEGGQSFSLDCSHSTIQGENNHHNLQLLLTGWDSAEITCVAGKDEQEHKLTMKKKGSEEKSELVDVEANDGEITKLECSSFDQKPFKHFDCTFSSGSLEAKKAEQKITFKIRRS
ncbi:hypothetical protein MHLP_00850 [Candidatus Mycoplasma haematolamae str. Purdue]|uniref:Lipoprotein n=1 Tax=Mycoplasma haematolamae (strain Purdue) TaxID=1212765 RepID=I7B916_MYCHA|nr:hypothetical protein [Candidatus Mycoplasma haematolamae]AFO51750.1 hypothetical protein MHLP_00850 [Candidatus Mycoplasma haematolamae str. Purdue]